MIPVNVEQEPEQNGFGDIGLLKELQAIKMQQLEKVLPTPKKKSTYTFAELHEKKDEVQKFLLPDLLPSEAVAVLIGEDGIGKTQILVQLCLHIAFGFDTFLGITLNAISKRTLIVATEEGRMKFTSAIMKQAYTLNPRLVPEEVLIEFTEGSDFDDFLTLKDEIEGLLKLNKYALIVLDAFSDLFTLIDGDINSNSHARRLLSFFQHICNEYGSTIVIIHHAAKTKIVAKQKEGKIFVEKNDSQGAGAITQKARTVLALSNDPKTINNEGTSYVNYLHVVKANLMGKHYVKNAIRCTFDANCLLHKAEGLVDVELTQDAETVQQDAQESDINRRRKAAPSEIPDDEHNMLLADVYKDTVIYNRGDLVAKLQILYGIGKNKIEQKDGLLTYVLAKGFIEKSGQGYTYVKPLIKLPTPQQNKLKLTDGEFDNGYPEVEQF